MSRGAYLPRHFIESLLFLKKKCMQLSLLLSVPFSGPCGDALNLRLLGKALLGSQISAFKLLPLSAFKSSKNPSNSADYAGDSNPALSNSLSYKFCGGWLTHVGGAIPSHDLHCSRLWLGILGSRKEAIFELMSAG